MRVIGNLIWKEVKELLTRQLLIPFIAIMVLFLFIGRAIRGEKEKAKSPQRVLVADFDHSPMSQDIIQTFKSSGLIVVEAAGDKESVLKQAKHEGIALAIIIPAGLSQKLSNLETAEITVYNLIKGLSVTRAIRGIKLKTILQAINKNIAADHLKKAFPGVVPENLQSPLRTKEYVVIKNKSAEGSPEMLEGLLMSQTFMIPIILLITIIYVSQMIAASIGQEKENKTLETLLTVPIKRVQIVLGKMLGAVVVALIIASIFLFAFGYYMGSFGEFTQAARQIGGNLTEQLGLGIKLESVLLIALSLFLAILSALALATLLAIFSDDAKSAQAAITPLMILCLIPYFFTMLFDIETASLPIKIIVYLIPFSYPFLTPKALIFGNYTMIILGFIYMALFSIVTIIIAARIFNSDRILTAKLRFRRR
jgi:ABC-2 type transport system permease protein